jgi:hypothetical protein
MPRVWPWVSCLSAGLNDNPDCQKRAGARPQALWGAAYNEAATGSKPGLVAFREQTGALHYVMH